MRSRKKVSKIEGLFGGCQFDELKNMRDIEGLQNKKLCYITLKQELIMSEQKPKIGQKGAGREITKKLSDARRKPLSTELVNIVNEISEREQKKQKKIAKSTDAEI